MAIEVASCIRRHHVYHRMWTPTLGEGLQCVAAEDFNYKNPYAVAAMRWDDIVGHVRPLANISCLLTLRGGGVIDCIITGMRRFSDDLS